MSKLKLALQTQLALLTWNSLQVSDKILLQNFLANYGKPPGADAQVDNVLSLKLLIYSKPMHHVCVNCVCIAIGTLCSMYNANFSMTKHVQAIMRTNTVMQHALNLLAS